MQIGGQKQSEFKLGGCITDVVMMAFWVCGIFVANLAGYTFKSLDPS